MKKFGILALLCTVSAGAYANKGFEVGMAIDQQLSAVFEIDDQYRFILGNDGAAFDYIFSRGQFDGKVPLSWYVGGGGYVDWNDDFGARLPLGINWQINNSFNAYGQLHPELNFDDDVKLQIGAAVGLTYHF